MAHPPHRVADVFRSGWQAYRSAHCVATRLAQVVRHILDCRTAALGGRLHRCDACGAEIPLYNSCRDRRCPTCQTLRKQRWLEQRRAEVLPVPYFHVVFTLPHALNPLIAANRPLLLGELFGTVNWVLQHFAADPQWKLCGVLGFIAVLHTWTQRLTAHYHLHCLVAGGAWNPDERVWRSAHHRYLFDKNALSKCFQARFIRRLESLRRRGKLRFDGEIAAPLPEPAAWDALIRRLWASKWIVYPKPTAKNPEQALDYLGRYTHRVAISDHRILDIQNGKVTFAWRDRADGNREKTLTIPVADFIGRFLLHILPRGFQKVRAYGWLAPRRKAGALAAIRAHLGALPPPPPPEETASERILRLTGVDVTRCPVCATGHLTCVGELPRARDGPS